MKRQYIVEWDRNCWSSFLQYKIKILKCYKIKEGFILIVDYRDNPNDSYYISDRIYTRKDFCFKANKCDIFVSIEKARKYAEQKLEEMYLSRCKYLFQERDEALRKLKEIKGDK